MAGNKSTPDALFDDRDDDRPPQVPVRSQYSGTLVLGSPQDPSSTADTPGNHTLVLDTSTSKSPAEILTGGSAQGQTLLLSATCDLTTDKMDAAGVAQSAHQTMLLDASPSSQHERQDSSYLKSATRSEPICPIDQSERQKSESTSNYVDEPDNASAPQPLEPLQAGIAAAQAGNTPLARLHLEQAIAANPGDPVGWLWFAWTADSPTATISALEQAQRNSGQLAVIDQGLAWARAMQEFARLDSPECSPEPAHDVSSVIPEPETASATPDSVDLCEENAASVTQMLNDSNERFDEQPEELANLAELAELEELEPLQPSDPPLPEFNLPEEEEQPLGEESLDPSHEQTSAPVVDSNSAGTAEEHVTSTVDSISHEMTNFLAKVNIFSSTDGTSAETPPSSTPPVEVDMQPPTVVEPEQTLDVAPAAPVEEEPVIVGQPQIELELPTDSTSTVDGAEQSTPPSDSTSTEPVILAIDDSSTIRKLVSLSLTKCGYQVVTAADGVNALEQIQNSRPALILLDINMPRLNGYQLCKLIKKHEKTRSIPVIMLSGKDGIFDKYRGKRCGCDDYITKPFESSELVKKVAEHLERVRPTA